MKDVRKLSFSVPLTVSGITVADIEGVAEIHFDRVGEPEIWTIDVDGRGGDMRGMTQRRLASDHPLYNTVKEAIWQHYESKLYDLADEIEAGRKARDRELMRAG